jgi:hypothetical protein
MNNLIKRVVCILKPDFERKKLHKEDEIGTATTR